jgi:RimJ/RimL family protein N-acetyltransferase
MPNYRRLRKNIINKGKFSIVPIRYEDRLDIMKWRNEQIYHLRQDKPLTIDDQEKYFTSIVAPLFNNEKPSQILFSFLEEEKCIGYGGLVHINWIDKNAEISFIIETALEKDYFQLHWVTFLGLIEQLAFEQLDLHKVFVYAFDLRPHLYIALEAAEYKKEAVLTEHSFSQGSFIDVVIYSKIKK